MKPPTRIFLVGPMGSGKSTIGRHLAASLGLEFQDSDHEIQRRTGVDIPTIFEFEGEAGFRARERVVIDELTALENHVVATGGGAVIDPENRRRLSSRGVVVYLHCSPEQQFERTAHDRNRPLLQTEDPLGRLRSLMAERDPLYRETADLVVSTEKRSAATVCKEIVRRLQDLGSLREGA
jgi:shikimate kinase